MVWIERALQLLFSLSAYAVYFKLHGLWEKKLESWISPRLARDITLWVGRIVLGLVYVASMLIGIGCSTILVLLILLEGVPLVTVVVAVPVGCGAFAIESVLDRLRKAEEEYEEWSRIWNS
jgi:hypothetical protein